MHDVVSSVFKAEKELRAFQRTRLQPGESATITFTLNWRAFAYYAAAAHEWVVESGAYEILIGASSRDIRLHEPVTVHSSFQEDSADVHGALADYYQLEVNKGAISDAAFTALYGSASHRRPPPASAQFTVNSSLNDIKGTLIGRVLYWAAARRATRVTVDTAPERQGGARKMMLRTMAELPLRSLGAFSGRMVTRGMAEGLAMLANGRYVHGIRLFLRSLPPKERHHKVR